MKKNRTIDEIKQPKKMTSIGGQALMEGLMMIGPQTMAMAVRLPDGQIHVETAPIGKSSQAAKIPFIRGSVKIFRQMITGTRYLLRSAQFIEDEINREDSEGIIAGQPLVNILETANESSTTDETENRNNENMEIPPVKNAQNTDNDYEIRETEQISETQTAGEDKEILAVDKVNSVLENDSTVAESVDKKTARQIKKEKKQKEQEEKEPGPVERFLMKNTELLLYFSAIFGIMISVGLFILLPNLLTNLTIGFWIDKNASIANRVIYSLFEGVLRITIFIAYLSLASNLKDIRRVWMYHGAEHKTISCYESGMPMTVDNVRGFSKHHPRCGTAFMFIILIISIIVFSFVPKINIILDLLIRLACVPILAGLSYEVIHWAARHDNKFTRALSWPGLMLQRLTTKEPDDSMLEVAIAAMIPVIPAGERGDEW